MNKYKNNLLLLLFSCVVLSLGGCKGKRTNPPAVDKVIQTVVVLGTTPPVVDAGGVDSGVVDSGVVDSGVPPVPVSPLNELLGINLAGAEFSEGRGVYGKNYYYPNNGEVDYYLSKHFNTVRLPFNWENLQTSLYAPLNTTELSRLKSLATYVTSRGMTVLIDPHNYARYDGVLIGTSSVPVAAFADFWAKLSKEFSGNQKVMFDLMNEPYGVSQTQWSSAAQAAVTSIRATGATNEILVPGIDWDSMSSWMVAGSPQMNIKDPLNNMTIQIHLYLDSDSSGGGTECVSSTIGTQRLTTFVKWLRANNRKAILGEFGVPPTTTCGLAVKDMLKTLQSNKDVIRGWYYWAGGPWWGNVPMAIEPINGIDRPQMSYLSPYLSVPMAATGELLLPTHIKSDSRWTGGQCLKYTFKNDTGVDITWSSGLLNTFYGKIVGSWGVKITQVKSGLLQLEPTEDWSKNIPKGSEYANFGICYEGTYGAPSNLTIK